MLKLSNGSEITLHTVLMRDCRLLGRNTHVAVFRDKEGKTYVVKDAWPQDHQEEERLTELKNLGINGMPKLSDIQPTKDNFRAVVTKTGFTSSAFSVFTATLNPAWLPFTQNEKYAASCLPSAASSRGHAPSLAQHSTPS